MRIITRYLLAEHRLPFLFALNVILFVLLSNFVVRTLDRLLSKGAPARSILEVLVLSLGWMGAMAVPMAVLVATLMAFGRLSADREILALRSAGVGPARIARPVLLAGVVAALVMVAYNEWVLPASNHRLANLLVEIHRRQPTLELEAGVFLNEFPGTSILAERVDDRQQTMEGVTIYEFPSEGNVRTIRAARGRAEWSADGSVLTLHLEDGEIHETDADDPRSYGRVVFQTLALHLERQVSTGIHVQERSRGDREMSVHMMLSEVKRYRTSLGERGRRAREQVAAELARLAGGEASGEDRSEILQQQRRLERTLRGEKNGAEADRRRIQRLEVEIHKKFAIPAACVIFVLVGAPLGVRAHRGGLGMAIGISFVFFLVYYIFLIGGETLADRGVVSPVAAMWSGNTVMAVIGAWILRRVERDLPLLPSLARGMRWIRAPRVPDVSPDR